MPPDAVTAARSFCRLCIAQCGVIVEHADGVVLRVKGDPDHAVSRGYTCAKGRELGALHHDPRRLGQAQARVDGTLIDAPWDVVLEDLAHGLRSVIDEHGPDAVAVYLGVGSGMDSPGRIVGHAFANALGTRSVYTSMTLDTPSKVLVRHLMLGHADLEPLVDLDDCRLLLLVGTNPVVSHGHTWSLADPVVRLRGIADRGQLWVVDPRRTESARLATRHLAIRPGTDHLLMGHLVREILDDGADLEVVARETTGVEELRAATATFTSSTVARACDVDERDLADLVAAMRSTRRIGVLTGTGTTMGASANVTQWLSMALAAITGSLDRPGGMWFNPGYFARRDLKAPEPPTPAAAEPGPASRRELPRRWGQYPSAGMLSELESGHVRALVVVGGNLLSSAPQPERVSRAMQALDVCAVADIVESPQTRLASHVLPCTGPLERADITLLTQPYFPAVHGQHTPAAVNPVGNRRPMWWALSMLAERLGLPALLPGVDIATASDEDVLTILGGPRADELRTFPSGRIASDATRFRWVLGTDWLPGGRVDLAPQILVRQLADTSTPRAPLVLTPRRQGRHVNSLFSGSRRDEPTVALDARDAAERGIASGDTVIVSSAHGSIVAAAAIEDGGARGWVSLPQGFLDHGEPNVGALTSHDSDLDELTGMVLQLGVPVTVRALHPSNP